MNSALLGSRKKTRILDEVLGPDASWARLSHGELFRTEDDQHTGPSAPQLVTPSSMRPITTSRMSPETAPTTTGGSISPDGPPAAARRLTIRMDATPQQARIAAGMLASPTSDQQLEAAVVAMVAVSTEGEVLETAGMMMAMFQDPTEPEVVAAEEASLTVITTRQPMVQETGDVAGSAAATSTEASPTSRKILRLC